MNTPLTLDVAARVFAGDVILCTELLQELHADCKRGWQIIEWLMANVHDEDEAKYVGTLFLEDFLIFCGTSELEALKSFASTALFLKALAVVDWASVPKPVRTALDPFLDGQGA